MSEKLREIKPVYGIKKESTIQEILNTYPQTMKFFNDLNMSCGGCFAVNFDTLENGALMHGMDINQLISQLNEFLNTPSASSANSQE